MYDIHRMIKSVQLEPIRPKAGTKLLYGESIRHEVGAEGVLIDSLHDNMLTSLYNKIKHTETDMFEESALHDTADELQADVVRFDKACESLSNVSSDSTVRLYAEAKRNGSIKLILAKIVHFFKSIPKMIMRFLSGIVTYFRKLKVGSRYLINRTEFFDSFNDNRIKSISENTSFNLNEIKAKHKPWLEKNMPKLDKMKLSGNDVKDYKKILSYVVGYLPVKPYGLNKESLGKIDTRALNDVFGDSLVGIIFNLASHAASMDDSNAYIDAGTLQAITALDSKLDAFPFLDVSSVTAQTAFDGTPLAGIHGLISAHHIHIAHLTSELNGPLQDAYTDRLFSSNYAKADELDHAIAKKSLDKFVKAASGAAIFVGQLKASLQKAPSKRSNVSIFDVLFFAVQLQQSLTAILLGDAEQFNKVIHENIYQKGEKGGVEGTIKSWGEIKKLIEDTKGQALGYASYIIEYKYCEITSLIKVMKSHAPEYASSVRNSIESIIGSSYVEGNTKEAKAAYDTACRVENMITDFIAGYVDNDNYVNSAMNEYVRRANLIHNASANMTKVVTTLMELICSVNNYRMAVLTDMTYRMQTVTDMFGLAKAILEDKKSAKEAGS